MTPQAGEIWTWKTSNSQYLLLEQIGEERHHLIRYNAICLMDGKRSICWFTNMREWSKHE